MAVRLPSMHWAKDPRWWIVILLACIAVTSSYSAYRLYSDLKPSVAPVQKAPQKAPAPTTKK